MGEVKLNANLISFLKCEMENVHFAFASDSVFIFCLRKEANCLAKYFPSLAPACVYMACVVAKKNKRV